MYLGLDVHKRVVQAVVLDLGGKVVARERFACEAPLLERFAKRYGKNAKVALEATTNTWAIVAVLEPLVGEVIVSNPLRTRAIAQAKVKTDKVDALVLAQLLRADFLPRVWQPDARTRHQRHLATRRASLTHDRTRIKNRIHAVLHQRMLCPPVDDLFGTRGLAWLKGAKLDEAGRAAIDSELRLLDASQAELGALDIELARVAHADGRIQLLMTLPGVDVAVAEALVAALGDNTRFPGPDHAASYLGLVPSTRQSADHCYHGPITKQGRGHVRWLLVQAAQHVAAHPGPIGVFFRRLAQKKNRNIAVVATARKLVTIAWHMLKNNQPYRYALPRATDAKLSRMRVRATGERRTGGTAKGAPRPAAYGQGRPSRALPSLDQVLEREGLPALGPSPLGEIRMLRDSKLLGVVESLQTPTRIPKRQTRKPTSDKQTAATADRTV